MGNIILKPGDSVSHPTFGDGIVMHADDAFCTVKFDSKETMFRLPEAFEKGFLSSKGVEIANKEKSTVEELAGAKKDNPASDAVLEQKRKSKNTKWRFLILVVFCVVIPLTLAFSFPDNDEGLLYMLLFLFIVDFPLLYYMVQSTMSAVSKSGFPNRSFYVSTSSSDYEYGRNQKAGNANGDFRSEIYRQQDEDLAILEDMIQMHSVNNDADLESHYGWDHMIDYDMDGLDDSSDNW